jgi:hypothetical protein
VEIAQLQPALDDVFDHALIHHGFTPYMRDYELIVHASADPASGIQPAYLRYLFRFCVEATTRSVLSRDTWQRSRDDRLIDYERGKDLDAFVWGVNWQPLYPEFRVVADSARARAWSEAPGTDFHEVHMESNAHDVTLVFADLTVTEVDVGYAPFVITEDEP